MGNQDNDVCVQMFRNYFFFKGIVGIVEIIWMINDQIEEKNGQSRQQGDGKGWEVVVLVERRSIDIFGGEVGRVEL